MIGIYKIENLVNGKKYIGQSIDIQKRFLAHKKINERPYEKVKQTYPLYRALKKYGIDNFLFEPIEICQKDLLDEREKYWIAYYHTYINDPLCNGYNLTLGGGGVRKITDEEIANFIDLWEHGFSVGEISLLTERNNHAVITYLKQFCPSYNVKEGDRRGRVLNGIKHRKPVIQYDFLGREVQRFCSVKEAVQKTGSHEQMIRKSLTCKTKGTKGYYFVYDDENKLKNLKTLMSIPCNNKGFFPVIQTDLNGNYINYFLTLKDAANSVGGTDSLISSCARGIYQTAYKYKWYIMTFELVEKYNLKAIVPKFN